MIAWIIVLFVLGMLMLCAEMFVPGGVLGILGALCLLAAIVVTFIAPGLAAMGWFMARVVPDLFPILFGVSLLVGFIAAGLLYASKVTGRGQQGE